MLWTKIILNTSFISPSTHRHSGYNCSHRGPAFPQIISFTSFGFGFCLVCEKRFSQVLFRFNRVDDTVGLRWNSLIHFTRYLRLVCFSFLAFCNSFLAKRNWLSDRVSALASQFLAFPPFLLLQLIELVLPVEFSAWVWCVQSSRDEACRWPIVY